MKVISKGKIVLRYKMVRCDIPCCYDNMCMHPYPGEPGYREAMHSRDELVKRQERVRAKLKSLENRAEDGKKK